MRLELQGVIFLDLDGTVRHSKKEPQGFIEGPHDIALFPDVEAMLWDWRERLDYLIVGITNQGGVAYGYKTLRDVQEEFRVTAGLFERCPFHEMFAATTHPQGTVYPYNRRSLLRKPDVGMIVLMENKMQQEYGQVLHYDASYLVGDREEDRECAQRAGIRFQHADWFFGREGRGMLTADAHTTISPYWVSTAVGQLTDNPPPPVDDLAQVVYWRADDGEVYGFHKRSDLAFSQRHRALWERIQ